MKIDKLKLHNFIVYFGTGIIFIAFFVAIAFTKKDKPAYFKYILAFIVLGLIMSLNTILSEGFKLYSAKVSITTEDALSFFQSLMLSLFLIEQLKKSKSILTIKVLFYLSITLEIILIICKASMNIIFYPRLSLYFCLIIFSIFYFRDLLMYNPTVIIVNSSVFWIVTGTIFFACISFPIYSLVPFLSRFKEFRNLRYQFFTIVNMSLIIFYFSIIRSYLCIKRPQNL